jgi:hypothetical protein
VLETTSYVNFSFGYARILSALCGGEKQNMTTERIIRHFVFFASAAVVAGS